MPSLVKNGLYRLIELLFEKSTNGLLVLKQKILVILIEKKILFMILETTGLRKRKKLQKLAKNGLLHLTGPFFEKFTVKFMISTPKNIKIL